MKLLLVGNHTCGNRGDGAILRGLVQSIEHVFPDTSIDIISRYPVSSSYLLGRHIKDDELYRYHFKSKGGLVGKIKKAMINRLLPRVLAAKVNGNGILKYFPMPKEFETHIRVISTYDAIIQVGGSFFVDLYGINQFEHALCALLAKKPIYMIGHSVGPFENNVFRGIAELVFSRVEMLVLRESISLDLMKKGNIPVGQVIHGVDTAWLVDNKSQIDESSYNIQHWLKLISQKPTVAITMRELAPFDKRLGVTQEQYEIAFSDLIKKLIATGFQVLCVSTCTGIDSYHKDDRMVAQQVASRVNDSGSFHVVMDELNDVELGHILSYCQLTIGTRLHSAIISMNFGTPAVAINYEHKSAGIMQQLQLPELSADVESLINGSLVIKITAMLDEIVLLKEKVAVSIANERDKGTEITKELLKRIGG
ncbi:colanic acid biosynthesis pyruvyl transferase WcaK [Serratia liquefaciens]|jgi:colanic acid/amylovoran biosynthesis protein|uniref:Colanic acid biosynthesis pyruvyl transferase WcaK n=1 Tax=Serratia liquefaciens TaxID=614 RepID=A0ABX7CZC4_SERLI|nr:colanic acid biosynthesis pyruvyl transferase WcaK [Serratia liquefaciens]QQU53899.1 colanic acid biosynthesis pyruvyl transferase WcaK [Serratia liquefaciens]